jgi:hypothetical protein
MRKLLSCACFLLATAFASPAQTGASSWASLSSLRAGQKIEIVETGLKKHTGTLMTVSQEAIQVREGTTEQAVQKANVARVTVLEHHHRLRNTVLLTVVGGGVGAGIGAAAGSDRGFIRRNGAAAAAIGLAGGAAVGAALPSHDTVYRAEPH